MSDVPDISVIVCTYNRAESLQQTLECLHRGVRTGLNVEILIVDNNSTDHTRQVVDSLARRLPLRYLFEPRRGKCHALNRALDEKGLGRIVAFLDDDMSPEQNWFKGVAAICERWPDHDIFTGRIHIVWPSQNIPGWARGGRIRGWAFSVENFGDHDEPVSDGEWVPGGHFWIRSRVLSDGRRFADMWATEPQFMLAMAEDGFKGVRGVDAVAGHRIQPDLLCESVIRARASLVGRSFANVLLRPHRTTKQAILFKKHPVLTRLFCAANVLRWSTMYCLARFHLSHDTRFERTVVAMERQSYFLEILRIARTVEAERACLIRTL